MNITKSIATMAFAGLLLASPERLAASGTPFYDGFEIYPAGMSINGTNGWVTSTNTVVVTNAVCYQGTNSVMVPPSAIVSNLVASDSGSNVWYDFYATNSMAMPANKVTSGDVNSNMTVQLFVETNGYPVVWHPVSNAWLVCSNDYWMTSTTNFNTNAWMRFTVCANFSNKTAAVFLNQHLLLQQVRFINTNLTQGSFFELAGGSSVTSFFDEVSVQYEPTNYTADVDNDGVPDLQEFQTYGNMSTARRLTITAVETNITSGGLGGGALTQPASASNPFSFDVPWTMGSTTLHWAATSGYYATNLLINGVSVGAFTGKNTGSASYDFANTLADATVTVAFAQMPVITASNSAYGTITPALTNFYPGESRAFTFQATNSHYFISALLTNGTLLATNAYSGWGSTNGAYTWQAITNNGGIEVQYLHKYTNSMSVVTVGGPNGGVGGTITASTNEVYPGESVTFTLMPEQFYGVTALTNNGTLAATFGGCLTTTNHTVTNIQANLSVQGVFTYTAQRRVPQDYATITDAMANAISGDTIVVSNGYLPTSGLVLSNGVGLTATNLNLTGGLTVNAGSHSFLSGCSNLVISSTTNNGLLVVSNGTVNLGTLVLGNNATVQVYNATSFVVNGVTYTGRLTIDSSFWSQVVAQTPPFSDDFERYSTNPPAAMAQMGHFGWNASDASVVVQGTVYTQGYQAVVMPLNTVLSNSLAPAASSNIWVDWYYRESGRIDESQVYVPRFTNLTALVFINTNGYVTVWDAAQPGFHVCSTDVLGVAVATVATSDWPRITVNLNYNTKKAAVFKNGRLLIQQLRFINTNLTYCAAVEWEAGTAGSTYLDNINVWTNAAPVVSDDANQDGTPDAAQIDTAGYIRWPSGSVFKIR